MKLSAVVIACNEEAAIGACVEALVWCDEVVVVDSGSEDRTRDVASAAGATVVEHAWEGYGRQKNFASAQARNDWVLSVDADEVVSAELRAGIEKALASPDCGAFEVTRRNRFMGAWLRHGEGYPDRIVRLFDRRTARWSEDPVHEKVLVTGRVGRVEGDLLHESAETLAYYLDKQNRYTTLQAEALFGQGIRPSAVKLVLSPLVRFLKFYLLHGGFLDGVPGLVHIAIGCSNTFAKNAKLFALWREAGK